MVVDGLHYYMLASYAVSLALAAFEQPRRRATADITNTGLTLSATALALSGDGRSYAWLGEVLGPRPGAWDAYAARLGCLVPTANGWVGYCDGAASVEES